MKDLLKTDKFRSLLADSETMIIFGVIIAVTYIVSTLFSRYMQKVLRKKAAEQNANISSFVFIKHVITSTIYLFGLGWALLSLPISATFARSIFTGTGVSTPILGFASQQVLSNVMSGIFLISLTICISPFWIAITEKINSRGQLNETKDSALLKK